MTNGIRFPHALDGKGDLHGMSSAFYAQHLLRPDNSGMAPKDELSTFAARLRFAMNRKGVNANQIEVKTGAITRQAVGMMLSGKTGKPTWDKLVLLSTYLDVRPEWLAEGDGPMQPAPILNDKEVALVEHFRTMSRSHQKDLCDIAERWALEDDESHSGSNHHPSARSHRRQ